MKHDLTSCESLLSIVEFGINVILIKCQVGQLVASHSCSPLPPRLNRVTLGGLDHCQPIIQVPLELLAEWVLYAEFATQFCLKAILNLLVFNLARFSRQMQTLEGILVPAS